MTPRPANQKSVSELTIQERTAIGITLPRETTLAELNQRITESSNKLERQLQSECESHLARENYSRMTAENFRLRSGDSECVGWFGHLPGKRAVGVAMMPDLFIFNHACTRTLFIELKVPPCRWQPGQQEMVKAGQWKLVTTYDEFVTLVRKFKRSTRKR